MRAKEFLFEYKRDITAQRLGPKLVQSGQREGITDVNEILAALEDMDPTPNKQYMIWLANQYIAGKFRLEDERIWDLLTWFHANKAKLDQRDIGQYDISSLGNTYSKYNQQVFSADKHADKQEEEKARKESEIIDDSDLGILIMPKTEFASQYWGRDTDWCTAYGDPKGKWPERTCAFAEYARKEPLYIWRDKNGEKYQFHFARSPQFMDSRDIELSPETIKYFRTQHPVLKKLFAMKEKEVAKDPWLAYRYALDVIKGRFTKGERVIANDPKWAYPYARDVIKGRFPEAEAVIAKDPKWAYLYTKDVIKGRFPKAEEAIAKDPRWAFWYAREVIKGRFPEAEAVITKDPELAYEYARGVIKGRFPEAEAVIAKDPRFAYEYARDVIKGRWPKAESNMKKSPTVWRAYMRDLEL